MSGRERVPVADRSEVDELLDRLSAALVENPSGAAIQLDDILAQLAAVFEVDHVVLTRPIQEGGAVGTVCQWARPGCPPLGSLDAEAHLPWVSARLTGGASVCLAKLDDLPADAKIDRASLHRLGIRSFASVPLVIDGAPMGSLMLGAIREDGSWPPRVVAELARITETPGRALTLGQAEVELRHAIEFDQIVAGRAANLIRAPVDEIDAQIVETLRAVGTLLGADRGIVLRNEPVDEVLRRTHLWVRPGTSAPPPFDPLNAFPWLIVRLLKDREVVALTRLDELPPEAARDRATLARNGVISGALTPMVVDDRALGMLAFATVTRAQQWSPDLVARLRLVGEIIASALGRRDSEIALRAALAENELLRERLTAENLYLNAELVEARDFDEIVGQSQALRAALEKVRQVADTTAPVLLLGETGTGKELIGRALHAHSRRRDRSFIAVNCAALPAALIESELFGHEKGAFTGATQAKAGRFELADQGTLLLDEIGELEPALQAKLLRVLEDGEIHRLGSTVTRKVDVRLIAATNRDLRREAREGRFRSDLYYRLSVFPIEVAPLRDRREDIPLLVWHFVQSRQRVLGRTIRKIPKAAMATLQAYEWPGNVRELQNVVERAMILSNGPILHVDEALGATLSDRDAGKARGATESLQDVERTHVVQILERCGWTIEGRGQAAERLGLNPSTLRNRMRKLGIKRPTR
jgi:transcriptional regulator with GAF, ATPase, and Fis domain